MCGIAGCVIAHGELREQPMLSSFVNEMTDALEHRGPDARGTWIDAQAGVALGHRRLSIIDLSELGQQPMQSRSGRYQIVYNGEVYNFLEIRKELEAFGHSFRGGSDTEVILAAIEQWSLEGAVRRFVGMFAFAVWDAKEKVTLLGSRSTGHQATVLWLDRKGLRIRFRTQITALSSTFQGSY